MNTVLALIILISQNTLKKDNMTSIATTIIKHLHEMDHMSIKKLADLSYTSPSTVIKFCQSLNFSTYAQFRQHLFSSIDTRKEQLHSKCKNLTEDIIYNQINSYVIGKFDINRLRSQVNQLILLFEQYECIHFYGAVFPMKLLESFSEDMIIMGKPILVHQIPIGTIEFEKSRGLNVIVTMTGRFFEINKPTFDNVCQNIDNIILISKQDYLHSHIIGQIKLPETISSDFDDIVYMLILDLLKYKYYRKRFKI